MMPASSESTIQSPKLNGIEVRHRCTFDTHQLTRERWKHCIDPFKHLGWNDHLQRVIVAGADALVEGFSDAGHDDRCHDVYLSLVRHS